MSRLEGFIHGFQIYEFYHPECVWGVRWDDNVFVIEWPIYDKIISEKDKKIQTFKK